MHSFSLLLVSLYWICRCSQSSLERSTFPFQTQQHKCSHYDLSMTSSSPVVGAELSACVPLIVNLAIRRHGSRVSRQSPRYSDHSAWYSARRHVSDVNARFPLENTQSTAELRTVLVTRYSGKIRQAEEEKKRESIGRREDRLTQ